MVTQIPNTANNVAFAKNALKYVQGQNVEKQSTFDEIKSSAPSSALFSTAFAVIPAANKYITYGKATKDLTKKFEIAAGTVKDEVLINTIKEGAENKVKDKGVGLIGKLLGKDVEKAAEKAGEKAVEKVTSKAAKTTLTKGLMGEVKSFALFNMLFQLTEIIPAFKNGGVGEGIKQTGKSAVNAVGDAIGFSVGAKLGAMAGSSIGIKIGSALGTGVAGPIGTIIGGALGMFLGGIGSTLIGKLTSKIVGKSFNEKQAEAQEEQQAQMIASDPNSMQELQTLVAQKIEEDNQDGKLSKDSEIMLNQLNTVSFTSNTQQAQTPAIDYTSSVNQGIRNNILNQQYMGNYELSNIPKNADGSIDHKIYDATPLLNKTA